MADPRSPLRALLAELHPRRFFLEAWQALDADAAAERERSQGYDRGPLIAFVVAALSLTFMEYVGSSPVLHELIRGFSRAQGVSPLSPASLFASRWYALIDLGWWAGIRIVGFLFVPWLTLHFVLKQRLSEYGLGTRGLRTHAASYFLLYLLVLPVIVIAARDPAFTAYYPFYKLASASWLDLVAWELLYALQFFALELFFRGFLLHACRRSLGSHAIFAALVPYCMIHFTKPVPEVLGSIVAGMVLGTLALRTRSIWGGVGLHVAVALTMDLLALSQARGLPTRLLPSDL